MFTMLVRSVIKQMLFSLEVYLYNDLIISCYSGVKHVKMVINLVS